MTPMEITVLTPQDLELLFDSNPDQFNSFVESPFFLVTKVRPVSPYKSLYRVYALVPHRLDPQDVYEVGIYEKLFVGLVSKAGLDYIHSRYFGRVFVDNKLHS